MDPVSDSDVAPTTPPYASAHFAKVAAAVRALKHPTQIGPYSILQLIGEGGMGTVYKAEQREPIRRIVAIKIIKLGMDTREVIARFESERQALAMMDHPNVARVLDAGATESGRPYFVMEYVAGLPITSFADRHRLTVAQRLELFIQACDAVQHAHQKAIIHRDLKPSNLLVTLQNDKPLVKIIDFGVAKALSRRLTEKTLFTETGQLLGTPEYMSPEQTQINAIDIDTRTDVYALGVVLYELLSGALPFDAATLRGAGYDEIQRLIRDVDPPRPSTKLSGLGKEAREVANRRQMQLETLQRQLKSELEWIPLKAMRKDRAQRYASAQELADDVHNYLSSRPLRAGPESPAYRARKFLRRNKTAVAASAAMIALLLAGIATTSWQAIRATRAERRTREALQETERRKKQAEEANVSMKAVNDFLTEDVLFAASPEIARGKETTVREAVDRAAETVAERFGAQPITGAAIHAVLADTYDALGQTARGLPHAQAALDIFLRERGPDDEMTMTAQHELCREMANVGRYKEAEPILRELHVRAKRVLGTDHPVTVTVLGTLAQTIRMQERFAEAEPLYREALAADRRTFGVESKEAATSLNNLAVLLNTQGRSTEAEALYRESLEIKEKVLGKDHPSYLSSMSNLARVMRDVGRLPEAETMARHVLREKRRVLKDDHPSTLHAMNELASALAAQSKYAEAEQLHREALERRQRLFGEDDPDTLQSLANLGNLMVLQERYADAVPLLKRAVETRRKVLGEDHEYTLRASSQLASAYLGLERFSEAEPLLANLAKPDSLAKMTPAQQAHAMTRYGQCLARLNRRDQAQPVLIDAERRLRETDQANAESMRVVLAALIEISDRAGRADDAARWRARLAAMRPASAPTSRPASSN